MSLPQHIVDALARAPEIDPAEFDPEELAEVEARAAEIRAGKVELIPHEQIQRTIAAMRPLAG